MQNKPGWQVMKAENSEHYICTEAVNVEGGQTIDPIKPQFDALFIPMAVFFFAPQLFQSRLDRGGPTPNQTPFSINVHQRV